MLIADYTNYKNNSLLEAELRIKERWKLLQWRNGWNLG